MYIFQCIKGHSIYTFELRLVTKEVLMSTKKRLIKFIVLIKQALHGFSWLSVKMIIKTYHVRLHKEKKTSSTFFDLIISGRRHTPMFKSKVTVRLLKSWNKRSPSRKTDHNFAFCIDFTFWTIIYVYFLIIRFVNRLHLLKLVLKNCFRFPHTLTIKVLYMLIIKVYIEHNTLVI